jgi:hypothetical protein
MKDLTTQPTDVQAFKKQIDLEQFTQVTNMLKKVTALLEQERYKSEKLDRMLNKTIDAHEVTKQRLLDYENEAGVPKSASEREAYLQGGADYKLNMVNDYMNEYFSVERWANDNGMTFDEGYKLLSEYATQDEFSNWTLNK